LREHISHCHGGAGRVGAAIAVAAACALGRLLKHSTGFVRPNT
jgi:hypothetical protein